MIFFASCWLYAAIAQQIVKMNVDGTVFSSAAQMQTIGKKRRKKKEIPFTNSNFPLNLEINQRQSQF